MPAALPSALPTDEQGLVLLDVAFRALRAHFGVGADESEVDSTGLPRAAGLFATVECDGELRGCIGFLRDDVDLPTLARRAVVAAATDDDRFPAVTRDDLSGVTVSISVLAPPVGIRDPSEIRIGLDGLIVERGSARGLLLPQVASRQGWDGARFCSETCRKAGLPFDAWRLEGTKVQRFEAVHFDSGRGEDDDEDHGPDEDETAR
jgi:AmmeMemoRadiSam system protein A